MFTGYVTVNRESDMTEHEAGRIAARMLRESVPMIIQAHWEPSDISDGQDRVLIYVEVCSEQTTREVADAIETAASWQADGLGDVSVIELVPAR